MTDIRRLSEAMYIGLCHKIGTREEISMRRDIADIADLIENKSDGYIGFIEMLSGSHREGFRLSGSDEDFMYWQLDHKVICELSQAQQYRQPGTTLFLMENVQYRPGFVLLQLLTSSYYREIISSCVTVNDLLYLSSYVCRKLLLRSIGTEEREHGPCITSEAGNREFDHAYCLSCDFWPPLAASWIQRCHSWPPSSVLYEIIVSGCHCMAIGSKGSPDEYMEWRLSFSTAEQKLVYAMNHCQFLVYGLLKLFLKEVIDQVNQEKMLCSYFMKTAVFWEIQENKILSWSPENILLCFWACYKRVMKWVYNGYCPNFFVTENNMFLGKILGCSQSTLFSQLYNLYEKGISCLLYCQSVKTYVFETLCNPITIPHLQESSTISNAYNIFREIIPGKCFNASINDVHRCVILLRYLKHLSKTSLTKHQVLYLHYNGLVCLMCTAFSTRQLCFGGNRLMYKADTFTCKMLKVVALSGYVPDMLYMAMYYYSTCRYTEAISALTMTEMQFTQQNLTYNGNGNIEKCIVKIGGNCLLEFLKLHMFSRLWLFNNLFYIKHLTLEQRISKANGQTMLDAPPLVLLRMLYVLCYSNINTLRAQEALYNLYIMVHRGTYIPNILRDISYQILGICQEICGDFHAAIDSYNLSLTCEPYNKIREASLMRIEHALSKIRNTI